MKKLVTTIFAIALIGLVFNSCKKDDETVLDNSITIEGTFTIGDKTFTNPTFDFGTPEQNQGYLVNYIQKSEPEGYVKISSGEEDIDLGDGIYLDYDLKAYIIAAGETSDTWIEFTFYNEQDDYLSFYSTTFTTKITKIDEVGGYIEGTYEGVVSNSLVAKGVEADYPVKGKFKVKRIAINTK